MDEPKLIILETITETGVLEIDNGTGTQVSDLLDVTNVSAPRMASFRKPDFFFFFLFFFFYGSEASELLFLLPI